VKRIVEVKPLQDFKVWLKFSDGVEGTVDLSDVAGKGIFCIWNDPEIFNAVFINTEIIQWHGRG
jgi:hypothetical protein